MSTNKIKEYVECTRSVIEKTPIWGYFLRDKSGEFAKCKTCKFNKELKTGGGSTSGLHKHMMSVHSINTLKKPASDVNISSIASNSSNSANNAKKSVITSFFNLDDNSLDAVLARMTAVDGLPFRIFVTSVELRKSLSARGFDVPKSESTIRYMVIKYGKIIRQKLAVELQRLKSKGERFSLSFDEWTSTRNRRYLNLNLHIKGKHWNLGLLRVHGSLPAEKCITQIAENLKSFGLSLYEDIVCITTDGASVMKKVGKLLPCDQQLCFAHAIHLAVVDILYKKPAQIAQQTQVEMEANNDDFESELDHYDSGFQLIFDETEPELLDELLPLITKVRSIVRLFRHSPTKNDDILQKYIKAEFGREKSLLIDIKTRWNSLYVMLERFFEVKNAVLKSLIDIKSPLSFNEEEMDLIKNLLSTLEPVKLAVEALCRRDSTLLTADATISFLINNLGNNHLALHLKEAIIRRINERRTNLSNLLQYLQKGNKAYDTFDLDLCLNFKQLTKTQIINLIFGLVNRMSKPLTNEPPQECESDNEIEITVDEEELESLQEKLDRAISQETNSKIVPKTTKTANDIVSIVKKELAVFEAEGCRGSILEKTYNYLNSVPPTSVESERVFSGCSIVATKIRSSLNDESLDILCFLRTHFKLANN